MSTPTPPINARALKTPLLHDRRVQRVLLPLAVALVLLSAWQWLVVALELPPYVLPTPLQIMATLWTDAGMLSSALLVTLKICLLYTSPSPRD